MPHVNVYYKMIIPDGYHRQPRNRSFELNLDGTAGGDISVNGIYTPPFFPQLPYTHNGRNGMARLLFWSVTDGMNGEVLPPVALNQTVAGLPLTITAWYFPISGDGDGATATIVDAFSANLGHLIDDTFVNVTSDATLTNDANIIGVVPTNVAETLVANDSVASTTEPFAKWILNGDFMPAGATTLNIGRGTSGIAIAVYQHPLSKIRPIEELYYKWPLVFTTPPPPEPWPEFTAALALTDIAKKVSAQLRNNVLELALKQVSIAAETFKEEIRRLKEKPSEK